jgi:hypothetical protein
MSATLSQPSRRSFVRAAAWSVPVVSLASAAPAFAASPCDPRVGAVIDWDNPATTTHIRESFWKSVTTYDPDGNGTVPSITLTTEASYAGNMKSGPEFGNIVNDSLLLQNNVGGLNQAGLVMYQSTTSTGVGTFNDRGVYTFTFTRPVTNLTFTVTDVDSGGNQYWDRLMLTPGFTQQFRAAALTGAGTQADPYRATNANAPVNDFTSSNGNVRVTYPGAISSFTITYWNESANLGNQPGTLNNQQAIFLSDLTFDYKPC